MRGHLKQREGERAGKVSTLKVKNRFLCVHPFASLLYPFPSFGIPFPSHCF